MSQPRPWSEASERNKAPILAVLQDLLDPAARVLEVGSGTGQHAVHFASALPGLTWICADLIANHAGIRATLEDEGTSNIIGPFVLDCREHPWHVPTPVDAVYSANTAHIMHMDGVEGLFEGAARVLRPGGLLLLYGPFSFGGEHLGEGNRRFDRSLRESDPGMGIRDAEILDGLAEGAGLDRERYVPMPANNFIAVWRRRC